jgi:hypothetical protein
MAFAVGRVSRSMGRKPTRALEASWRPQTEIRVFPGSLLVQNAKSGKTGAATKPCSRSLYDRGATSDSSLSRRRGWPGMLFILERRPTPVRGHDRRIWVWSSRRGDLVGGEEDAAAHPSRLMGCMATRSPPRLPLDCGLIAVAPKCSLLSRGQEHEHVWRAAADVLAFAAMALRLELRLALGDIAHLSAIASALEPHGRSSLGGSLAAARGRRKLERNAPYIHLRYVR